MTFTVVCNNLAGTKFSDSHYQFANANEYGLIKVTIRYAGALGFSPTGREGGGGGG